MTTSLQRLRSVVLSGWLAGALGAQTCVVGAPTTLGVVVPLPSVCPGGAGTLPGATCVVVEVQCAGLAPIQAQLRVVPPNAGVAYRGTVVFGSGGGGSGFYANGDQLFPLLTAMGFRVVDRSWLGSGGWTTAEAGLRRQSCRYATLISWIKNNLHVQGAFCVSGNSGGSAEIGYALTTWQMGNIIDVAVPTSGPAVTRLDYGCGSVPSAEWSSLAASIVPPGFMVCTPTISLGANGVCQQCASAATLQDLRDDSVMHLQAQVHYPTTKVHFLYGTMDCGQSIPIGLNWSQLVTSDKVIEFVGNTGHGMSASADGREAIRRAIDNATGGAGSTHAQVALYGSGCGTGAEPAPVIQAYGTPWLGNSTFTLRVERSVPNSMAVLLVSSASAFTPVGAGCTLLVDLSPANLVGSLLVPTDARGFGGAPVPVPNVPTLAGYSVYLQWAVGHPGAPLGLVGSPAIQATVGTR